MKKLFTLLFGCLCLCGTAQNFGYNKETAFIKTMDSLAMVLMNQLPDQVGMSWAIVHEGSKSMIYFLSFMKTFSGTTGTAKSLR